MTCPSAAVFGRASGVGVADWLSEVWPSFQLPTTRPSSTTTSRPTTAPTGRYFMMPCRSSEKSMSSIITTNRKSTATAPT